MEVDEEASAVGSSLNPRSQAVVQLATGHSGISISAHHIGGALAALAGGVQRWKPRACVVAWRARKPGLPGSCSPYYSAYPPETFGRHAHRIGALVSAAAAFDFLSDRPHTHPPPPTSSHRAPHAAGPRPTSLDAASEDFSVPAHARLLRLVDSAGPGIPKPQTPATSPAGHHSPRPGTSGIAPTSNLAPAGPGVPIASPGRFQPSWRHAPGVSKSLAANERARECQVSYPSPWLSMAPQLGTRAIVST